MNLLIDGQDVSRETHATRVATDLRAAILAGDPPPGSKVNLNHLRDRYDVSLSPLREALSRLVAERLVEIEDHRGFRIAPASRDMLAELTEMRADLLCLGLGLSIARGDLDWEGRVLSALHRAQRGGAGPTAAQDASDYLRALVSGCGRPMLCDLCAILEGLNIRYRSILAADVTLPDPAQLAEAAVARKQGLAEALLRERIEQEGAQLAARWPGADR
jgi:GntR family carbon starvation induced transcriptional regulator